MFANWRLCTEQQNDNVQFQREFRWLFITDGRSHEASGAALAREKLLVLLSDEKILSNFCTKKFQLIITKFQETRTVVYIHVDRKCRFYIHRN